MFWYVCAYILCGIATDKSFWLNFQYIRWRCVVASSASCNDQGFVWFCKNTNRKSCRICNLVKNIIWPETVLILINSFSITNIIFSWKSSLFLKVKSELNKFRFWRKLYQFNLLNLKLFLWSYLMWQLTKSLTIVTVYNRFIACNMSYDDTWYF